MQNPAMQFAARNAGRASPFLRMRVRINRLNAKLVAVQAGNFLTFTAILRAAPGGGIAHRQRINDLARWHRTARVFLVRLLMVHGEDAPEVLRRMADELEWLAEAERRERERH